MATQEQEDAASKEGRRKEDEILRRLHWEAVAKLEARVISRKRTAAEIEKTEHPPAETTDKSMRSATARRAGPFSNSSSPEPSSQNRLPFKIPKRPAAVSATSSITDKVSIAQNSSLPAVSQSPASHSATSQSASYPGPPSWYMNLKTKSSQVKPQGGRRELLEKLKQIRPLLDNCIGQSPAAFNAMRQYLHEMAFEHGIDGRVLKDAKMLDSDRGLPQIFDNDTFPFDIKADAIEIYQKWCGKDFDVDIFRGISRVSRPKGDHGADRLDKNYPKRRANIFGANGLVNGQWWPTQLTTIRDGGHGSMQGGIYGNPTDGAWSIVMSNGYGADKDEGDEVWYCGTDSHDSNPTDNTNAMVRSQTTRKPVRVLRSYNMRNKNSEYRPRCGFRYDGLYRVFGFKILDHKKAIYQFHLRRCPGQTPIRYQGPEARPTDQEIHAFETDRGLQRSSE